MGRRATTGQQSSLAKESPVNVSNFYQGFVFTDVSTRAEDGRYRARVAIVSLAASQTRSQRFIDLDLFSTHGEAINRGTAAAKAWIDTEVGKDSLSLPTNFAEFS